MYLSELRICPNAGSNWAACNNGCQNDDYKVQITKCMPWQCWIKQSHKHAELMVMIHVQPWHCPIWPHQTNKHEQMNKQTKQKQTESMVMIQGSTLSNMAGSNCVPTLRPTRLHHIYKHSPPSPPSPLGSFPPPCRSTSPFTHSSSTSFPSQLQNKLWLFLSFLFLPRPDLVASHYKHTLLLFVALLIFLLLLIIIIFCLLHRLLLSSTFFSPLLSPLALISAFASKTNLSSLSPCPMPKSKSAHHIHIWQCHSTSSHLNHHTSTNMHQMRFKSRARALEPEVQRSPRFLIQDNKAGRWRN